MSDAHLRVVVLGPPGEAQQQLRDALDELGAQTLAVGDFNQLDPAQMREQQPDVWLVSVDENTDAAVLEPWQPLFDDPDATVVFDDADVTRRLSGWDLARWARHLAAKVLGRDDVLPPVRAGAERLPRASALLADGSTEGNDPLRHETTQDFALEQPHSNLALVDNADAATFVAGAAPAPVDTHDAPFESTQHSSLSLVDEADVHAPAAHADSDALLWEPPESGGQSLADDADFAALSASFDAERNQAAAVQADSEPAMSLDDLLRAQPLDGIGHDRVVVAEHVGSDEKTPAAHTDSGATPGLSLVDMGADLSAPRKVASAKAAVNIDIGGLSLEPLDAMAVDDAPVSASRAVAGDNPNKTPAVAQQADGLIAIIAGLGGPDAVRQFLGALPATLPVPVLLWQHLDAGKHDRLAQQLAKATRLPVYLAKAGDAAQPGAVGVVSTGLVMTRDNGLRFVAGDGGASLGLAAVLNDPATAIVVLSGAEAAIVEPARTHSAHGGKVLVQTPMTCFDGAAASALDGNGAIVALPAELAGFATARWSS